MFVFGSQLVVQLDNPFDDLKVSLLFFEDFQFLVTDFSFFFEVDLELDGFEMFG